MLMENKGWTFRWLQQVYCGYSKIVYFWAEHIFSHKSNRTDFIWWLFIFFWHRSLILFWIDVHVCLWDIKQRLERLKHFFVRYMLFYLLWTGCNPLVLMKWKVCAVLKVINTSLLGSLQSREWETAGDNHMLSSCCSKLFCLSDLYNFIMYVPYKKRKLLCSKVPQN